MLERLPIVGVMGSSTESHGDLARPLGGWLARRDVHLLTGGGGGVMSEVSRAFAAVAGRRGRVIGVLPSGDPPSRPRPGYPNPWVEIAIRTHLPLSGARGTEPMSRNHLNVLTSDVVVALPGKEGTASEIRLAVDYGRPVVAFVHDRSEMPELPGGVTVRDRLADVQVFVTRVLGLVGPGDPETSETRG